MLQKQATACPKTHGMWIRRWKRIFGTPSGKNCVGKHTRAVPIGRLVDFKGSVNFRLQDRRALHQRDGRGVSFLWFCLLDHVEMCAFGQLDKLGWRLFTS